MRMFRFVLSSLLVLFFVQLLSAQEGYPYGVKTRAGWERVEQRWGNANFHATLNLKNGSVLHGQILFADEGGVFALRDSMYLPILDKLDTEAYYFGFNEIESIYIRDYQRNMNGLRKGALYGGLGGLLVGVIASGVAYDYSPLLVIPLSVMAVSYPSIQLFERYAVNHSYFPVYGESSGESASPLSAYTVFQNGLPPGVYRNDSSLSIDPEARGLNEKALLEYSHALGMVFHQPRLSLFPYLAFGSSKNMVGHSGIGLALNLNQRHYIQYAQNSMDHFISEDVSSMRTIDHARYKTHMLSYGYKIISRGPLQFRNYELSLEAGASYNRIENTSTIIFTNYLDYVLEQYDYIDNENIFGYQINLAGDYYLNQSFSFRLTLGRNTFKAIDVIGQQEEYPLSGEIMGTEDHSLNLSSWDIRLGFRMHIL